MWDELENGIDIESIFRVPFELNCCNILHSLDMVANLSFFYILAPFLPRVKGTFPTPCCFNLFISSFFKRICFHIVKVYSCIVGQFSCCRNFLRSDCNIVYRQEYSVFKLTITTIFMILPTIFMTLQPGLVF